MADELHSFTDAHGVEVSYRRWLPSGAPRAIVEIAHGASEHSGRYARFAEYLAGRGYAVFADDHRGHGVTAKATGVGKTGPGGWDAMIEDLHEFAAVARAEAGDVPLVLFGHSMGSFLAQAYIQRHGAALAGVVLSGSTGSFPDLPETVAALETLPADDPAPLFAAFNAAFEPARTAFDWLSRDEAEVDKYVADPMCGDDAPLTMGFVVEMLRGGGQMWTPENEARIPKALPVLFITGEADPVSGGGAATVRELEARYRANGLTDVTALDSADAPHELLNETNRDDVQHDVAEWLDRVTGRD
jgi:alpha-beta hydrolase superfamily lysophospholipase